MIIIGNWHVALSAIIAYQYHQPELGMQIFLRVLLVSGANIDGYVEMDTINTILHYMQQAERPGAAGQGGER